GDQQTDEHGDDGDDDQQLDEGEAPASHGPTSRAAGRRWARSRPPTKEEKRESERSKGTSQSRPEVAPAPRPPLGAFSPGHRACGQTAGGGSLVPPGAPPLAWSAEGIGAGEGLIPPYNHRCRRKARKNLMISHDFPAARKTVGRLAIRCGARDP